MSVKALDVDGWFSPGLAWMDVYIPKARRMDAVWVPSVTCHLGLEIEMKGGLKSFVGMETYQRLEALLRLLRLHVIFH